MSRLKTNTVVRVAFFLFFVWTCWRLFGFYQWATGNGAYVPRPDATAGFVPLGAVMGLIAWIRTGIFDQVLPAAEVIILGALAVSLLFKRGFCGWICPVGSATSFFSWIGRNMFGKIYPIPVRLDRGLRVPKYLIAGLIIAFLAIMPPESALQFQHLPYYATSDLKILLVLLSPDIWFVGFVLIIAVTSLFWGNTWCRYLCPLGALYSAFGSASAGTITRDENQCVFCGACTNACTKRVDVKESRIVRAPECDGCLDCVNACPEPGVLAARFLGFRLPVLAWPLLVTGVWLLIWAIAVLTGHWYHGTPAATIADYIRQM